MSEDKIELLFDNLTIQRKVRALGLRLQADEVIDGLLIISLLGGSVMFLTDLLRAIPEPIRYDFVNVGYSTGGPEGKVLDVDFPIPTNVSGQNILVLKDVVEAGVTELYLQEQLQEGGAETIRFATLIDLPSRRKTDFQVDYRLFTVERKGTFVGYGLKYQGLYGNLPYVGMLTAEEAGIES